MPKSRPPYVAEFRRQMVELVRSGRTPEALAREFEPRPSGGPVMMGTQALTCPRNRGNLTGGDPGRSQADAV